MDVANKLAILADAAKYDASCASSGAKRAGNGKGIGHSTGNGICHSYTPDGRCVSLLKILLTNVCIYDCLYCVNRVSSDIPRARFTVPEIVTMTLDFYRRNYIEGLFLSSGVIQTPDYTMEQLVEVARQLRETHAFGGYIHLKAMPDVSPMLLAAAGRYADRVSVNIELPTPADLHRLAPDKSQTAIVNAMTSLRDGIDAARPARREQRKPPAFAPAGQSTQMIVGATTTTDSAILSTASALYEQQRLRRVYYSAYSPIPKSDTFLPAKPAPLVREHRLYQADWLLRFYGFRVDELTTIDAPNLDMRVDPKTAWAVRHPAQFPVDINTAPREMLLRTPGLGQRSVDKILRARRLGKLSLKDLQVLRVKLALARPFIITGDWRPSGSAAALPERQPQQPLLWSA
ncbi:MAG TPA: putative DNA modification/repair radical SAM protein [Vicinamibacterales bacterium]|nr:putative DNA modification/repair radical SAM protein [Vicinamibacterales bacterium]